MRLDPDPHYFGLDKFVIFFGKVEDRDDPLTLGRCKVRIFGTHPEDTTLVPTEDLPWAWPIMPITSAGTMGVGAAPVGLLVGSIVVGFFADGMERQQPFMLGSLSGSLGHFNYGVEQPLPGAGAEGSSAYGPNSGPDSSNAPGGAKQLGGPIDGIPKGSKDLTTRCAGFAAIVRQKFPALADIHACALIGNLCAESTMRAIRGNGKGSGPRNVPPPPGTHGVPYGFGQWIGPRLNAFLAYAKRTGYAPDSDEANIGFFLYEVENSYYKMITNLASKSKSVAGLHYGGADPGPFDCSTIEGSTAYVMNYYERPSDNSCGKRITYAKMTLAAMNKPGASVRTTARTPS